MQNNKLLVNEWIARSGDDELNIKSILKHRDGTPANVCFLSQQMTEKYFKALLLSFSNNYPKTHDLSQLTILLECYINSIAEDLKEEIIFLSPFYITSRYPSDIPIESFTWEMAEKASEATLKIKEFVLSKIK